MCKNEKIAYAIAVVVQIGTAVGSFSVFGGMWLLPGLTAIISYVIFNRARVRHMWHCLWTNTLVLFIATLVLQEIQSPTRNPDGPNRNGAALLLAWFPVIAAIYNIPMLVACVAYVINRKPEE